MFNNFYFRNLNIKNFYSKFIFLKRLWKYKGIRWYNITEKIRMGEDI